MDSVKGFISVGFKFILVPSSGVEPFLSALPALSFFLFRSLSLRFVFAFYTCSKGVLKRIKTSFPEKPGLEYYPERVEIFSGTELELGIRSRTFTFAGTKGINRSGSDTELLAKSSQAIHSFSYTASRESNGVGGPLRERLRNLRKTTECLSTS